MEKAGKIRDGGNAREDTRRKDRQRDREDARGKRGEWLMDCSFKEAGAGNNTICLQGNGNGCGSVECSSVNAAIAIAQSQAWSIYDHT